MPISIHVYLFIASLIIFLLLSTGIAIANFFSMKSMIEGASRGKRNTYYGVIVVSALMLLSNLISATFLIIVTLQLNISAVYHPYIHTFSCFCGFIIVGLFSDKKFRGKYAAGATTKPTFGEDGPATMYYRRARFLTCVSAFGLPLYLVIIDLIKQLPKQAV